MSPTRTVLTNYLSGIEVKGKVLDIGGNIWSVKGKTKSWGAEQYVTLGIQKTNKGKDVDIVADLNQVIESEKVLKYFDTIFALEIMQFVYDPLMVLRNLRWMMKPGGVLYVTFHQKHLDMKGEDYLRYTRKGIIKLLETAGFKGGQIIYNDDLGYFIVSTWKNSQ